MDLRFVSEERSMLGEGVELRSFVGERDDGRPVHCWVVIADPKHAEVAVQTAPWGTARTVGEHVDTAVKRGKKVLAATNADFFHLAAGTLTPYGAQIVDGVVIYEPHTRERYGNLWFGMTFDGTPVIGDAEDYFGTYVGLLKNAVGGGVLLLKDGTVVCDPENNPGPRTWVGYAPDGTVALAITDGRQADWSVGMTLAEQAQLLLDLDVGITDAINLDGGGSTAMVTCDETGQKTLRNRVCVSPERPVADTLMIVQK